MDAHALSHQNAEERVRSPEEVAQNPVATHYNVMLQISHLITNLCQQSQYPIETNSNSLILGFYP